MKGIKTATVIAPVVPIITELATPSEVIIPDTFIKQWVEEYNDTHHLETNYTHKNMVEIPDQTVNYTDLGFSDDPYEAKLLYHWTNKKHTRCRHYRDFLNKCLEQDLVSEDQEDNTSFIELLKKVGWWDAAIEMLGKAGMEKSTT